MLLNPLYILQFHGFPHFFPSSRRLQESFCLSYLPSVLLTYVTVTEAETSNFLQISFTIICFFIYFVLFFCVFRIIAHFDKWCNQNVCSNNRLHFFLDMMTKRSYERKNNSNIAQSLHKRFQVQKLLIIFDYGQQFLFFSEREESKMNCKNVCRLCNRLVLSQAINFANNTVIIDLPAGSYSDGCKYCIVLAQSIPQTAAIGSNVVFTIGGGAVQYPLVNKCCSQVTACGIRTRTKYAVTVETSATGANFKMLGNPCCQPNNNLRSVSGTSPAAPASGAGATGA